MTSKEEKPSEALKCLDKMIDRANHDEYLGRIGTEEALEFLEQNENFKNIIEKDLEETKHLRKQLQKARNEKRRWKNKALQQKEILDAIKKEFYDKLYNWHLLDNMPSLKLENEPKEYGIIRQWIKQWLEVDKNG